MTKNIENMLFINAFDNKQYSGKTLILDRVGKGWHDILTRLVSDLIDMGWDKHVAQVKEKFGSLRFYVGDEATEEMYNRISVAEDESYITCERCGEPGTQDSSIPWIKTLCEKHIQARLDQYPSYKKN